VYKGKKGNTIWLFSREINDIEQFIAFSKSSLAPHALRLEFFTSLNPSDVLYGSQFMKEQDRVRFEFRRGFWEYDESNIDDLLLILKNLIENDGLNCLNSLSIPILNPPRELSLKLFSTENKEEVARVYAKEYDLDILQINSLLRIEQTILQMSEKNVDVNWDYIERTSLFFGELVRQTLGGIWKMHHYDVLVGNIGMMENVGVLPLKHISNLWGHPYRESFKLSYIYSAVKRILANS
jgi:hypothetical protein